MARRILFIDDDHVGREIALHNLRKAGYDVTPASDGREGLALFSPGMFDLVVTDLKMPVVDGMKVLETVRRSSPGTPVLVITAFGNIETAVEAMKRGATDFVGKPFLRDQLLLAVEKALEHRRLVEEVRELRIRSGGVEREIVCASAAMRRLIEMTDRVAATDATVLVTGESGTGKEAVARRIHVRSSRAEKPFVAVNCAAIPGELLESDLFGHRKGAFTGAFRERPGKFRQADGGTLFLDEIGDMAPELQAKLLRAIEDKAVRPVGSDEAVAVDVRVVSATNRDLGTQVREGQFREDLYYRLAVLPVQIPPLRERREDIPLLAEHFLRQAASATGREALGFAPETMAALLRHPWPGNVRELENVVQRAVALTVTDRLQPDVLLLDLGALAQSPADRLGRMGSRPTLESLAQEYITLVLREVGGDKSRAAEILGISRRTLYRRENKLPADDTTSQTETS